MTFLTQALQRALWSCAIFGWVWGPHRPNSHRYRTNTWKEAAAPKRQLKLSDFFVISCHEQPRVQQCLKSHWPKDGRPRRLCFALMVHKVGTKRCKSCPLLPTMAPWKLAQKSMYLFFSLPSTGAQIPQPVIMEHVLECLECSMVPRLDCILFGIWPRNYLNPYHGFSKVGWPKMVFSAK